MAVDNSSDCVRTPPPVILNSALLEQTLSSHLLKCKWFCQIHSNFHTCLSLVYFLEASQANSLNTKQDGDSKGHRVIVPLYAAPPPPPQLMVEGVQITA